MAVIAGKVEPINLIEAPASLRTPRGGAPGQVGTQPMIFSVNHQVVSFDGRFQVVAAVGDEILVAGTIKEDGVLHATAYENLTRAVGKTGVFPSLVLKALYVSSALTIPFFFWVMLRIGADFSQPATLALALGMIASIVAPILLMRAYDERMQRDAQELATYARDHLLSRRD